MAVLRHEKEMLTAQFDRRHVDKFCRLLADKFRDRTSDFGKEYLRLLISEVKVDGDRVDISGSHAALAGLLKKTKVGELERVPTFGDGWLPKSDGDGLWEEGLNLLAPSMEHRPTNRPKIPQNTIDIS